MGSIAALERVRFLCDIHARNETTLTAAEIVAEIASTLPEKNPHAVALGRLGGQQTSEAKQRSSAANGKKGGRPRKARKVAAPPKKVAESLKR
jgi:hypothetical protein